MADLTGKIPTVPPYVFGEIVERLDYDIGILDYENVSLELVDSYVDYTQGFWWTILLDDTWYNKEVYILLTLTEDLGLESETETYLFQGRVLREGLTFPEHYLNDDETDVIRTVKLTLESMIGALKKFTVAQFIAQCAQYLIERPYPDPGGPTNCEFIEIKNLFKAIMELLNGESGEFVVKKSAGIMLNTASSDYIDFSADYYISTTVFFSPGEWPSRYATTFDVLCMLCRNFCCLPRISTGDGFGVCTIYPESEIETMMLLLSCRGFSFPDNLTVEVPIESTVTGDVPIIAENIRVTDKDVPTESYWSFKGTDGSGEAKPWMNFDFDVATEFVVKTADNFRAIYTGVEDVPPNIQHRSFVSWLDSQINVWRSSHIPAQTENGWPQAVFGYWRARFTKLRPQVKRSYSTIKWTEDGVTSQRFLYTLKRHLLLNVGQMYATEVRKDITNNTSTITWVREVDPAEPS